MLSEEGDEEAAEELTFFYSLLYTLTYTYTTFMLPYKTNEEKKSFIFLNTHI